MSTEIREALEGWVQVFSQVRYDDVAGDERIAVAGRELYELGAVYPVNVSRSELVAVVHGSRGESTSKLLFEGSRCHMHCSCSGEANGAPCVHIAGLVRFLCFADEEEIASAVSHIAGWSPEYGPFGNGARQAANTLPGRPGEELKRSSVGVADERYPGISIENVSRQFSAMRSTGTIIDGNGSPDGTSRSGGQTDGPSQAERDKRYRPVFTLRKGWMRDWNPTFGFEPKWGLRPGLVYLRKDGAEGAVGDYTSSKPRYSAEPASERLYRYLLSFESRTVAAASALFEMLAGREREHRGAGPEIYTEGSRAEQRVRLHPCEVTGVSVAWRRDQGAWDTPRLYPEFRFFSEADVEPIALSRSVAEGADAHASLLLIPDVDSGRLWWMHETPNVVATLQRLLRTSFGMTLSAAESFASHCRDHFGHLVEVDTPPEQITVVDLVPVPILDFDSDRLGRCKVNLSFRYWNTEVALTAREDGTAWIEGANAWEFCRRDRTTESQFRQVATDELRHAIAELKDKSGDGRTFRQDNSGFGWYLSASGSILEETAAFEPLPLLLACAEDVLSHGFELRYRNRPVSVSRNTPSYRVRGSGEGWFEAELGFFDADGFVPLDHVPHTGSAVVNGRVYIISKPEDLDRFRDLGARVRFDENDLATLAQIEELTEDSESEVFEPLRALRRRIAEFESIEEIEPPAGLGCELRPYQREGLSWLWFLHRYELGGCLADDMGLGKTIQALAALLVARRAGEMERAVVVAPVSTLGNWARESASVTPEFNVSVHAGTDRAKGADAFSSVDIVFVSYATLRRDINLFKETRFDYLILDESQAVKNPRSKTRKAIRALDIPHRRALSGTPIENNTLELWSIFDLLSPGMLGPLEQFKRRFARPIEEEQDVSARELLQRIVRPLLLRRRKRDVAPELPEREERELAAQPERKQLQVYESLRRKFKREVERKVEASGIDGARIQVLEAMLRLRQAAILPELVDPEYAGVKSAKLDLLDELVATIHEEGNKVLVFSQFVAVINKVEERLNALSASPARFRIDGSTPHDRRQTQIADFQNASGSAVFLISLKAGGAGINLTAADYVILLDPWWNPAVEAQAIDRAHRIGRDGTVIAYRLITEGTIEEKMLRLQEQKRELAESIIQSEQGGVAGLSREDLEWLFA